MESVVWRQTVLSRQILDFNEDGNVDLKDIKHLMLRYEIILLGGLLLIILPIFNSLGIITVSSDTFWILAGVVISAEALLEIYYEKKNAERAKELKFISEDEER